LSATETVDKLFPPIDPAAPPAPTTPRRGRPPGSKNATGTKRTTGTKRKTKAQLAAEKAQGARSPDDRKAAVLDAIALTQIPLSGLAVIEQRGLAEGQVGSFTLDLVTIEGHKEPLADAVVGLAEQYPVLGRVLDKLAMATPFGALLSVTLSLGVQIAENHRSLPTAARGLSPNLVARDDLVAQLQEDARRPAESNGG
jgi:hypothetical protein